MYNFQKNPSREVLETQYLINHFLWSKVMGIFIVARTSGLPLPKVPETIVEAQPVIRNRIKIRRGRKFIYYNIPNLYYAILFWRINLLSLFSLQILIRKYTLLY